MEEGSETLRRIHRAAMEEFLEKGFQEASLRRIVKNAGVTTGAFYGYYSSKTAVFAALVEHYPGKNSLPTWARSPANVWSG